jgi:hypothetical protein
MTTSEFIDFGTAVTENAGFWFLWIITATVCIGAAVHAVRREDQILGFVPVFCLAFGYFYVFQSAIVALTLYHRLQPWMFTLGQALALVCLLATLYGHHLGSRPDRLPRTTHPYEYNPRSAWAAGIFLMLVAIAAQYSFFGAMLFGDADYSITAYWYMLYLLFYPGLGMCIRVYSSRDTEYHTPPALLLLCTFSVVFMYFWISQVRRGPLFPFFIVVAYTYYLTTRRVNRAVLVSGLITVGLMMLLFVTIRDYSSKEGSWTAERLERVNFENLLLKKPQIDGDNEYLYHCGYSATVYESNRYQFGTGYLNLAIHWIPRQWWPDKPTLLDQGWFPRVSNTELQQQIGWQMTPGAAFGGVAETFQQFAWAAPLFWLALGWGIGRSYAYAYYKPTALRQIVYVGIISTTHWLVSQGFVACFIPMMFYTAVPLVLMYGFRVRKPRAPRRRVTAPGFGPYAGTLRPPMSPTSPR